MLMFPFTRYLLAHSFTFKEALSKTGQGDNANQWGSLCANLDAAIVMAVVFGLTTVFHIYQGIKARKWYTIVIITGGLLECLGFVIRAISIQHPTFLSYYAIWFVLILVSPLWINAFVYMIMGRLIYNLIPSQTIRGIPARRYGLIFVLLDIFSFIIQFVGAVQAVGDSRASVLNRGLHIYMGGVSLQRFFILVFMGLAVTFHGELNRQPSSERVTKAHRMLYILYAVLLLITLRIIFRLVEYASGFKSSIPNHEAFMYCLDSLPMFTALVLLNITHPGTVMPGQESDMPSRKERRLRNLDQHELESQNIPSST